MHSSFTDPEYVSCQSLVDTAAIGRLVWEERWQIIRQSHKKKQIRPKIEKKPPMYVVCPFLSINYILLPV
jgi:transposase